MPVRAPAPQWRRAKYSQVIPQIADRATRSASARTRGTPERNPRPPHVLPTLALARAGAQRVPTRSGAQSHPPRLAVALPRFHPRDCAPSRLRRGAMLRRAARRENPRLARAPSPEFDAFACPRSERMLSCPRRSSGTKKGGIKNAHRVADSGGGRLVLGCRGGGGVGAKKGGP